MKFSIVIVTYNRHKELYKCLESIQKANCLYPFEVIVIFNGDRTYLERCSQHFKNYKLHFIPKTTPSNARNHALTRALGEYIFFLDDDCTLPQDYFSKIDFTKPWDVLGGPDQTPPESTHFQTMTGRALSSSLCMGPTHKRHTQKASESEFANEKSLILCNLWGRASLFKFENFKFNANLFRNEENFLLKELKDAGKVLHYSPKLYVYHSRKQSFDSLGSAIIKSGECRVQNFSLLPSKKELIYLLPLFWFGCFAAMIINPHSILVYFFALYSALIVLQSLIVYHSFNFLYFALHYFILSMYSIGLLKGIWKYLPTIYTSWRENKSFISESKSK